MVAATRDTCRWRRRRFVEEHRIATGSYTATLATSLGAERDARRPPRRTSGRRGAPDCGLPRDPDDARGVGGDDVRRRASPLRAGAVPVEVRVSTAKPCMRSANARHCTGAAARVQAEDRLHRHRIVHSVDRVHGESPGQDVRAPESAGRRGAVVRAARPPPGLSRRVRPAARRARRRQASSTLHPAAAPRAASARSARAVGDTVMGPVAVIRYDRGQHHGVVGARRVADPEHAGLRRDGAAPPRMRSTLPESKVRSAWRLESAVDTRVAWCAPRRVAVRSGGVAPTLRTLTPRGNRGRRAGNTLYRCVFAILGRPSPRYDATWQATAAS
jgi:hypothetical protein